MVERPLDTLDALALGLLPARKYTGREIGPIGLLVKLQQAEIAQEDGDGRRRGPGHGRWRVRGLHGIRSWVILETYNHTTGQCMNELCAALDVNK